MDVKPKYQDYQQFKRSWKLNLSKTDYTSPQAMHLRIRRLKTGARGGYLFKVAPYAAPTKTADGFSPVGYKRLGEAIDHIWQLQYVTGGPVGAEPRPEPRGDNIGFEPMKGDELWRHYEDPGQPTRLMYVSADVVVVRAGGHDKSMTRKVFDAEYVRHIPFKVLYPHDIWCDSCGEIHPANPDHYDGDDDCVPRNWRRIFIESYDENETF
jgi:hypothetical protein